MRFTDLLRLSLSALWQQKVRTLLTVAGIAIGTFALAVSLSLGRGFHEEVDRQLHHGDQLRQILVYPSSRVQDDEIPKEELAVPGDISPAKRERLRKAIVRRWPKSKKTRPPVLLKEDLVAKLRALPHVSAVVPLVVETCDVRLGDKQSHATACVARLSDDDLRDRIVAGSYLSIEDGRSIMVGEYLLYQWGIVTDADVEKVIGKKLHVVFPIKKAPSSHLQELVSLAGETLPPEESQAVEKALRQFREASQAFTLTAEERKRVRQALERALEIAPRGIPGKDDAERATLEKALKELLAARKALDLTDAENKALERVFQRYFGEPRSVANSGPPRFDEDLTIVGVLREYVDEDENLGMQFAAKTRNIDLFLAPQTAERLFRATGTLESTGYDGVIVTVDDEDHLKEVVGEVKKLGVRDFSLAEFVDKVRGNMQMATFLTSFLAGVAVLVASLGITNTMFMSVLERTREIGVMKAVGARDRHIQMIFLVEGALLGILGGALGVLGCWLASFPGDSYARQLLEEHSLLSRLRHTLFVFPWWLVLGVPFFAGVVTTVAAVLPARRAAKVNPITALRHE